ncbi:hypothetical protein B0G71_4369 [Paraburkholderia sp. BL27I4N3]|nr:hypothetical protein B0G71_4369 [Paraburkholderia sp. BL27I4N3]
MKSKPCTACKLMLPLTAFNHIAHYQRARVCKACEAADRPEAPIETPPEQTQPPAAPEYGGMTAMSAHLVQASLKHEPRADAPLLAHTETRRVPAVVQREGVRLSPAVAGYLRAWGVR